MTNTSNDPKSTTPPQWSGPNDARKGKGAGTYPNYYVKKTRSGHVFMMDDSQNAEHVTLQHRSGAMIQFMPDGAIQFVSHNGQYNLIFGENRVMITGAYDVTVNGGGSLKVDGDYNVTVKGNHNTTVHGDVNLMAKNMNHLVTGKSDLSYGDLTMKMTGSTEISTHNKTTVSSDGGLALGSTSDSVAIGAAKDIGIKAGRGMMMQSKGDKVQISSAADTQIEAKGGNLSLRSSGGAINMDGAPMVQINDGASAAGLPDAAVTLNNPPGSTRS
jgi:uncharacterized protein (DUF2345 family)